MEDVVRGLATVVGCGFMVYNVVRSYQDVPAAVGFGAAVGIIDVLSTEPMTDADKATHLREAWSRVRKHARTFGSADDPAFDVMRDFEQCAHKDAAPIEVVRCSAIGIRRLETLLT
jgi:hypothetical protein